MSQGNKGFANPASPADVARDLVERSTPRLYCPTCEMNDPSPLVRDSDGTMRHSPCPAVSVWRGKPTPAEYPVRDVRSYPEREEYVEALRALLANHDPKATRGGV